jgi:hypothetical protein
MHRCLATLLLLTLPGMLCAQPSKDPSPEEEPSPEKTVEELHGKVSLALNTGGHTVPIFQMRFTRRQEAGHRPGRRGSGLERVSEH